MWGLFPPCLTPCRWVASLTAGVLVVLGVYGGVLCCVPADYRWLFAGAWAPWLCQGVVCPEVLGLMAFNRIQQDLKIHKLQQLNIPPNIIHLIHSFLSSRPQAVKIDSSGLPMMPLAV
ncbi:hypothetical protein GOODEAATRI_030695 [Goodea atripinnis]|uniref:Uncharacterized protein n=1 Tax=Goodea atripinnis TaxID=208336 RepID=A0ABV0PT15_9TELE